MEMRWEEFALTTLFHGLSRMSEFIILLLSLACCSSSFFLGAHDCWPVLCSMRYLDPEKKNPAGMHARGGHAAHILLRQKGYDDTVCSTTNWTFPKALHINVQLSFGYGTHCMTAALFCGQAKKGSSLLGGGKPKRVQYVCKKKGSA